MTVFDFIGKRKGHYVSRSLDTFTWSARQGIYEQEFLGKIEPLVDIDTPKLAISYPNLRPEIEEAYLKLTTFSVRVWVNYDAAAKLFYLDSRIHDTGRLRMTKDQFASLERISHILALPRVHIEIATPFQTLCTLRVTPNLHYTGRGDHTSHLSISWANDEHIIFRDWLVDQCEVLLNLLEGYPHYQGGITLYDLQSIAGAIRFQPSDERMADPIEDPEHRAIIRKLRSKSTFQSVFIRDLFMDTD